MTEPNPVELNIKHALEKNGFPGKVVKLPFKPVFQSCKQYDTTLDAVLNDLKAQDILGVFEGDFIVFRSPAHSTVKEEPQPESDDGGLDPSMLDAMSNMSGLGNLSGDDMQKAMDSLTPEQREELQNRVASMSAEDKKNLLQSLSQMFNTK